ncbi:hypothetical protein KP509_04G039800 [Ceratopteris richardii]|uniref:Dynein regulatory complex protein 9 n=1 Tax=Ceratopteris richardii TaxID=49495 RepID=A0A8T2UW75_CERRI|nr:hypothetical protein KP509_04G039800 [Ceratopteris richardii]
MDDEPLEGQGAATGTEASTFSDGSAEGEDERQHEEEEEEEAQQPSPVLSDFVLPSPSLVSPFIAAFLQRFSELFHLGNDDANIEVKSHGQRPKHLIEAIWLKDVLQKSLEEIEDHGSFSFLAQVVSDHEALAKRVPASLEHIKSLNTEMHLLRQQIQAEDFAHKEAVITWNKNLLQKKQDIKDLKAQNKLTAKYRADMAVAQADCKRRFREEKLLELRDEINQLTDLLEVEKRVNIVCNEFLKKQNLTLMEEAINLASGHENDVLYMDMMISKLKNQKIEKEDLLSEIEPRYMSEMSKIIAEKEQVERVKTMSIDELRIFETQTRAVIKIQRIWRGRMDRAKHAQEVKKIVKKRKELRNKLKKEKKEKAKKEGGKKGADKKKVKKKK